MSAPDLDDIRLIDAIDEFGSIGSAASQLHISQPSASQRLALLERRLGAALVDRDTTGARLTEAGERFIERARRALAMVDEAVTQARSPSGIRLSVGAISSLAPAVFPALMRVLPDVEIGAVTDHGPALASAVSDGRLDAAVIGLPPGASPARGVSRLALGTDPLVVLRPNGVSLPRGRARWTGRDVVLATYRTLSPEVEARLVRLGARVHHATTTATGCAIARQQGWCAIVPRTTARYDARPDEEVEALRMGGETPLWLVSRGLRSDRLVSRAGQFARLLGLS